MPTQDRVLFRGKNGDLMISYLTIDKDSRWAKYHPRPDPQWDEPGLSMRGIGVVGKRSYRSPEAWHAERVTDPEDAEPEFDAYASCSDTYENRCAVLEIKLWP